MAQWPRKAKWFKEWSQLMLEQAEVNDHGRVNSASTSSSTKAKMSGSLAARSKRHRNRKRRLLKRKKRNAQAAE